MESTRNEKQLKIFRINLTVSYGYQTDYTIYNDASGGSSYKFDRVDFQRNALHIVYLRGQMDEGNIYECCIIYLVLYHTVP